MGTGLPARKALSHIPLCYRQLSRLFTASYGVSPKQYQVTARIEESKRMLSQSKATITDVAMELGFSSSQHFATQFKNVTGMTARQFEASLSQPA
jgi:AraC family transcriptional regulator